MSAIHEPTFLVDANGKCHCAMLQAIWRGVGIRAVASYWNAKSRCLVVRVKVLEVDDRGKVRLSMKALEGEGV